MTKVDPHALRAMLLDSVRMLAASAEKQNAYIAEHHVHHDELALDLDAVSGHEHAELWADEGVATAVEWQIERELSREALSLLEGNSSQHV